jgi:hypothetical protein
VVGQLNQLASEDSDKTGLGTGGTWPAVATG